MKKFKFLKMDKQVRVSEHYHRRLRVTAAEEDITISAMLNSVLEFFFGPSPEREAEIEKEKLSNKDTDL